jgi:hypothetical protein
MRAKRIWRAHLHQSYSIDWVRGTPHDLLAAYAHWHTAIRRAADTGDAAKLVDLLRSDEPLHRDARDLLADLLACRRLKRKRGGQADPTRVSLAQGALYQQAALYRYWRAKGLNHDEALHRALLDFKTEEIAMLGGAPLSDDEIAESVTDAEIERLHGHLQGRHGTTRRLKMRRRAR